MMGRSHWRSMAYSQGVPLRSGKPWGTGGKGELALVARIRARAGDARAGELRLGIGDDAALIRVRAGEELAVTTDLSIAGRHFQLGWHSPEAIGHRTLARGLSDLAAMGARPIAAFLSLGLPRELAGGWLDGFLDGFLALAEPHRISLAGGDLSESPVMIADIVLTGAVTRGKALLRSGAREGDLVYVTGSLGGAAAGLARLEELAVGRRRGELDPAGARGLRIPAGLKLELAPHLFPRPRIAQGLWLARRSRATAAIDLSDGLSTDLAHLCEESEVAAEVDAAQLAIHPGATLSQALNGGEDYELLFTAPATARLGQGIGGVAVTRIGRVTRARRGRPRILLRTAAGVEALAPEGWEHFSRG